MRDSLISEVATPNGASKQQQDGTIQRPGRISHTERNKLMD